MIKFDDYSRKGLVTMNTEFDNANDGILTEYVMSEEAKGIVYPPITPAEVICENYEEKKNQIIEKLSGTIEDAATFVDNVMNAIIGNKVFDDNDEESMSDKLGMVDEMETATE